MDPGFLKLWTPTLQEAPNFPENCMKVGKFWARGGVCPSPLPQICQCFYHELFHRSKRKRCTNDIEMLLKTRNSRLQLFTITAMQLIYLDWSTLLTVPLPSAELLDPLLVRCYRPRVHSTTGGYVFTGICLFRGPIILPLVPCPFPGRYPSDWSQIPSQGGTVVSHPRQWGGWVITCYAAGGTPLAVSRRTFLFHNKVNTNLRTFILMCHKKTHTKWKWNCTCAKEIV